MPGRPQCDVLSGWNRRAPRGLPHPASTSIRLVRDHKSTSRSAGLADGRIRAGYSPPPRPPSACWDAAGSPPSRPAPSLFPTLGESRWCCTSTARTSFTWARTRGWLTRAASADRRSETHYRSRCSCGHRAAPFEVRAMAQRACRQHRCEHVRSARLTAKTLPCRCGGIGVGDGGCAVAAEPENAAPWCAPCPARLLQHSPHLPHRSLALRRAAASRGQHEADTDRRRGPLTVVAK